MTDAAASRRSAAGWASGEAVLSLALIVVFGLLSQYGTLDGLEVKTLDARFRHRPVALRDDRIALLYISDECIERLGNWPWPRSLHARAVDLLAGAGARMAVFDIIFHDADLAESLGDELFTRSCASFGNVVFPLHIDQGKVQDPDTLDVVTEYRVVKPSAPLASIALALGFVNLDYQNLNPDGIIRRLPLTMKERPQGEPWPALDLAVAQAAAQTPFRTDGKRLWLGEREIPLVEPPVLKSWNQGRVPFSRAFLVNYLGEATAGIFPAARYSDFIENRVDPAMFRDKIVLIGASAVGLSDTKLTPCGEMPGVLIHANILQNLLKGDFLFQVSPGLQMLLLVALGIMTHLILTRLAPLSGAGAVLVLLGVFNGAAFSLFSRFSVVVEIVCPTFLVLTQFIGGRFWIMLRHLREAYHALERRTLELERSNNRLDQQVRNLGSLNDASRRFAATLDMDLLGKDVLSTFFGLWEADDGVLAMGDTDNDTLSIIRQEGYAGEDAGSHLADPDVAPLLGRMLETGAIVSDPAGRWFTKYIPLVMGSRLWGAVLVRERTPRPREEEQGDFWSTLSGLASTALENARLYNLATVDVLTRLFVRRYFQVHMEQEFKRARRYRLRVALLMTDIDKFKTFNDTYGHQLGDVVLREVAGAVRRSLREIDIPARYGGEEFGIVLPETDLNGALIVGERIRKNVESLSIPRSGGGPLRVTISIGVSSFPDNAVIDPEDMIKKADEALYRAKEGGRNRVESAPRAETPS